VSDGSKNAFDLSMHSFLSLDAADELLFIENINFSITTSSPNISVLVSCDPCNEFVVLEFDHGYLLID